jgi:2-haloacid dehalogenase
MGMATVAVFDINETTLDLGPVRSAVGEVMGRPDGFGLWFGRLLQTSMAVTATGEFADFGTLAASALDSVAQSSGIDLRADGWDQVKAAMGVLQPYPDVAHGLELLSEQGWRLLALTNSAQGSVDAQLRNCAIHDCFEEVLSVDTVRAFKPASAPYRLALETAGVEASQAVMVAAHDWDLAGAKAVGMQTAFVARAGMPFATAYPPADHVVADFVELATTLGKPS